MIGDALPGSKHGGEHVGHRDTSLLFFLTPVPPLDMVARVVSYRPRSGSIPRVGTSGGRPELTPQIDPVSIGHTKRLINL